jgi:hypothetical protein
VLSGVTVITGGSEWVDRRASCGGRIRSVAVEGIHRCWCLFGGGRNCLIGDGRLQ